VRKLGSFFDPKEERGMNRQSDRLITIVLVLTVALVGCGKKLSGTYTPSDNGIFEKLTFTSGNKVEITVFGSTSEVSYEVDGNKLKITNAGQTQVFTIDDKGCLDGGGMIGKYCKK
jgi:hypothetical protein